MKSELSKRIAKIENRGFQAAEIRAAYFAFTEHGIVPSSPKLAKIVKDLKQCLEEIDASVPTAPQVSHDHQNTTG